MSDKIINIEEENRRRRRINKIKKIIIGLVITCIIVPTVLSAMLAVKVVMLENEIEQLKLASSKTITTVKEPVAQSTVLDTLDSTKPAVDDSLDEKVDLNASSDNEKEDDMEGIRKVYLTFDDGPSDNTDAILDILAEYNVKATFFVLASDDLSAKRIYNRIVDEGHTLAMHSYTHVYNQIYANMDNYKNDVLSLQSFLEDMTGIKPVIYRFPGGSSNTVMNVDIQECISFLEDENITYFDWNVSSGDATGNGYPASTIAENVISGVLKQDDSIVLLHDASNKNATVESLPIIIESLLEMDDVLLLPLTEDSELIQHTKKK